MLKVFDIKILTGKTCPGIFLVECLEKESHDSEHSSVGQSASCLLGLKACGGLSLAWRDLEQKLAASAKGF